MIIVKTFLIQGLEFSVRVAKKSGGEGARFTRSFASNPAGKVSDKRPVKSRWGNEIFLAGRINEVEIVTL